MGDLKPGLGTTFSFSSTLPATPTLGNYVALTWVLVGSVTDVPTFGPEHDVVTHVPLATGITAKFHGAKNNGSITVPMALDYDNAGQLALKLALTNRVRGAFRVNYADNTADYFQGKVMSFRRGASIGDVVTAEAMIEIETDIVEDSTP